MSQPYRGLAYHFSKIWILLEITEVIYHRKPSRTKEYIGQHRRNRAVGYVILEMFIQINQIHAGIPSPLPSVTGSDRPRISPSVMVQRRFKMHYAPGIPDKLSHHLPEDFLAEHYERCVRIPMRSDARSLNLSNAVAITVYEALRQIDFPGLQGYGKMKEV